jgi:hypothetical protein
MLHKTLDHNTAAFYTIHPYVEQARASRGALDPVTNHNGMIHNYNLFKLKLDSLTDLAQSRLIGNIRNRECLVHELPRGRVSGRGRCSRKLEIALKCGFHLKSKLMRRGVKACF